MARRPPPSRARRRRSRRRRRRRAGKSSSCLGLRKGGRSLRRRDGRRGGFRGFDGRGSRRVGLQSWRTRPQSPQPRRIGDVVGDDRRTRIGLEGPGVISSAQVETAQRVIDHALGVQHPHVARRGAGGHLQQVQRRGVVSRPDRLRRPPIEPIDHRGGIGRSQVGARDGADLDIQRRASRILAVPGQPSPDRASRQARKQQAATRRQQEPPHVSDALSWRATGCGRHPGPPAAARP